MPTLVMSWWKYYSNVGEWPINFDPDIDKPPKKYRGLYYLL